MKSERMIMGVHSIEEVLKISPDRFIQIFCTKPILDRKPLGDLLKKHKIPVKIVSKEFLTKKVQTDSHQGIVAVVEKPSSIGLKELLDQFFDKGEAFVLILDRIYDPHNLGAILRSAECFQVDAVIWSKNRGADITPVVTKTSSGASELIEIVKVSNLSDAVGKLQEEGFEVLAAELSTKSESLYTHSFQKKTALIMGSEGEGIQPLLSKKADKSIFIPMKGQIDSLNVSQATAVMLAAWSQTAQA